MHVKSLTEALFLSMSPQNELSFHNHLSRGRKLRELCARSQMFLPESPPGHSTDISWAKTPAEV